MYYAIVQKSGAFGLFETSERRGGYKNLETAVKRCMISGNGHVIDDQRRYVAIVCNKTLLFPKETP